MSTIDNSKLKHLAIFATVIESGSFAQAARKLNTSRSRVSEQVAQLEEELGVRLIQRSTRRLSLTEEGRKVYDIANVLPGLVECVNDIASSTAPSGRVSLSVSTDVAQSFVLPVLEGFRQQYPGIQLNIVISDNMSDLIGEEIDLAIRTSFREDSAMVARTLRTERAGIYASSDYIARYGMPKNIADLEKHHWLTLSQASSDGTQQFVIDGKGIEVNPAHYYSCNSPYMIQTMLLSGLGLGVVLPSVLKQEIKSGRLVQVMPELLGPELTLSLLYPSRHQVPKRTRCLIDYLLEANKSLSFG